MLVCDCGHTEVDHAGFGSDPCDLCTCPRFDAASTVAAPTGARSTGER